MDGRRRERMDPPLRKIVRSVDVGNDISSMRFTSPGSLYHRM